MAVAMTASSSERIAISDSTAQPIFLVLARNGCVAIAVQQKMIVRRFCDSLFSFLVGISSAQEKVAKEERGQV